MTNKLQHIQLQYQGFVNTFLLWKNNTVFGVQQFEVPQQNTTVFNALLPDNLRLGKRVERFVSHELKQHKAIEVLIENAQVQHNKRTMGEIDCILKQNEVPIHLEIVYKFYLYDHHVGTSEIDHWIGPNRNDTLLKKLTKLKEKQLPLLYSEYTKPLLNDLKLNAETIKQRVYFKAQLFIPYRAKTPDFKLLNKDCLVGFYIHHTAIEQFKDCKFYIPTKLNWLVAVQMQVKWIDYKNFNEQITPIVLEKTAPLCWLKFPNGIIKKFFVVWWD